MMDAKDEIGAPSAGIVTVPGQSHISSGIIELRERSAAFHAPKHRWTYSTLWMVTFVVVSRKKDCFGTRLLNRTCSILVLPLLLPPISKTLVRTRLSSSSAVGAASRLLRELAKEEYVGCMADVAPRIRSFRFPG